MDGLITGENDERVGLSVIDNNDVEHVIEMEFDGEIKHHQCEAYADKPRNRTPEENEYNEQARKFAQYYVYLERGYDTVPPEIHPERINAVREAIAAMDETAFETLFGTLHRQIASHQGEAERVLDLPDDIAGPDSVLYRQHVYLGFDPLDTEYSDEAEDLAARYGLDLTGESVNESDPTEVIDDWRAFTEDLGELAAADDATLTEGLSIDGVSSLSMAYVDEAGHEHIGEPSDDPYPREPDTLVELPPMEAGTLAAFQAYLTHNLACQIRDCFVRMGLEPPEPFRILGFGRYEAAEQYRKLELYPDYIDPEEERAFA